VSDFFEPPPRPPSPEPERHRPPPWFGPPRGTLAGSLPLDLVLARTVRAAVCVTRVAAYPTGFEFEVVTLAADEFDPDLDPVFFDPPTGWRSGAGEVPPQKLRIGVQFADGAKATNLGVHLSEDSPPRGPVLCPRGGGGGGGSWQQTLWVWPLPPAGPLTLACEWPAVGIPLTRRELDAQTILEAASRAQVVFADPGAG
jgi:hypothetical protein